MTQSMVCGACGAAAAYGRLSCPECGELFATVAGVVRRPPAGPLIAPAPEVDPGLGLDAMIDEPPDRDPVTPPVELTDDPMGVLDVPLEVNVAPPPIAAAAPTATVPPAAVPAPQVPTAMPTPGAYVPPVLQPAGPAAPARTWAGHGATDGGATLALAGAPAGASVAASSLGPADGATAAGSRAILDRAQATEFVAWLAIAGAMLAIVGFLLPWSSITVIGSRGVGYLDRWGLAGPWHILVVAGLVGLLVAAVLRERIPTWLGIGLPGLGLGALLVGLVWPYLVGPLGGSLGAMAAALGALMLVGAGIAAILVDRHAGGKPSV